MNITRGRIFVTILLLVGKLPFTLGRLLARAVGKLYWLIPNRSRTTTIQNVELCFPQLSSSEKMQLAKCSLQHTAMLGFEMAAIWHHPFSWVEKRIVAIEGKEIFDYANHEGKGVIILLPHIGNWEVFSQYLPTITSVVGLYQPASIPELEVLIKASRQKSGAIMVPTNTRGVAKLLKHLKAGGTTGVLPDQVPTRNSGWVDAPFFNHSVKTMTLVSQLVQRTGSAVIGAYAQRVPKGFTIVFQKVHENIYSENLVTSVTAVNSLVEDLVRRSPEQYQWEYKRFRNKAKRVKKEQL